METLIAQLFQARDIAHRLHLNTRSFAAHMALGELYGALVELADDLAESYQGKYGVMDLSVVPPAYNPTDARAFIAEFAAWAETSKGSFNPADTHLLNEWDNVIACIYKTKYKLDNLA